MAKKSKVVRNEQRKLIVERYAERRLELKKASVNPNISIEDREKAMVALHRLPRNASPTRLRGRGVSDGRPRGFLRRFGLSRVQFRQLALRGDLPGVTKSSW